MREIKIIREQINKLIEMGYIYEVGEGKYRGLGKDDNFYLEIKGGIK